MNYIYFIISLYIGYLFNRSLSKTGHKINKRLPKIRLKFIQISPNIQIHFRRRYIWLHHWLTYSVILIITLTSNAGVLDTIFSKGLLVGGIIQGLSFPDWMKVYNKYDSSKE